MMQMLTQLLLGWTALLSGLPAAAPSITTSKYEHGGHLTSTSTTPLKTFPFTSLVQNELLPKKRVLPTSSSSQEAAEGLLLLLLTALRETFTLTVITMTTGTSVKCLRLFLSV